MHSKRRRAAGWSNQMPSPDIQRREFLKQTLALGAVAAAADLLPGPAAAAAGAPAPAVPGKIKVGVIGCGNVSGSYLPDLVSRPYIELVSVCDLVAARAQAAARQYHVPHVYPHIAALLAGAPFDLLVNITSMPAHFAINQAALQAGRHVWSEKPMALEVADGKALVALAREKGLGFWAAPTCVASPQFRFMAETIARGELGRVCAAHGAYGHGGPDWSAWFYQRGGGSLYDLGVYNVTTLTGLLGPVTEVTAMTDIVTPLRRVADRGKVLVEADDNTMLIMRHGPGVLSHVQTGFCYAEEGLPSRERRQLYTLDIKGQAGNLHLQGWDWAPGAVEVSTRDHSELRKFTLPTGDYTWQYGAAHVARCLLTKTKSPLTPEHALHVLEVMNAAHESQRTGRRIAVATTFPWPVIQPAA